RILTVPIIASFTVSVVHFLTVYRLRVGASADVLLGAMLAAMSVQWTVARAVATGLIKDRLPFVRTAKGAARAGSSFPAVGEAVVAMLLILGAVALVATNVKEVREIYIFAGVLV